METKEQLTQIVRSWQNNPIKFCKDCFNEEPDVMQRQMFDAIVSNNRVAVRSGNGPGKTWTAARLSVWFFVTRPLSIVVTTAPTWQQVQKLLWKEIRACISQSKLLQSCIYLPPRDAAAFMIKPDGTYSDDWMMLGRSTDRKENMQGFHAPYLMFVVDEGSGVDDDIYEAIEGTQTQKGVNVAKTLVIGNPTRAEGYFYDVFHSKSSKWTNIHLDCRLSPRVSEQWIEDRKDEYGEDSAFFQVHVLGNFPPYGDDVLIPLFWIEQCMVS